EQFLPTCLVSGAPKSAAGTQSLTNVFQRNLASREDSLTEDLFPSGDRRSNFVQWLGATLERRGLVDCRESPMRRANISEVDRLLPSLPNATVALRRPLLSCADDAAGTARASGDHSRLWPARPSSPEVPHCA